MTAREFMKKYNKTEAEIVIYVYDEACPGIPGALKEKYLRECGDCEVIDAWDKNGTTRILVKEDF